MKFFTSLFKRFKAFFAKKPKTAETIGYFGEVEHFEGGYYTLPVVIENETAHGGVFQQLETPDKKEFI